VLTRGDTLKTGDAQGFGTFILGRTGLVDDVDASNAQFGGRMAVGGSVRLNGFEIGIDLDCSNLTANNFTLIATGDLNATNGRLTCGTFLVNGTRADESRVFLFHKGAQ
jgi:choice-of-anchor A domain-containing protein